MRIAIVVARFNDFVTERLLTGAREGLTEAGLSPDAIDVLRVPGAFEIPLAAEAVAAEGRVDGVICLGCLIKGATPHFEYISSACAHGIMAAQSKTGVPMAFGVLFCDPVASYDSAIAHQNAAAVERLGQGDIDKLLRSGHTWNAG